MGKMEGAGLIKKNGEIREVIARNNIVVCDKKGIYSNYYFYQAFIIIGVISLDLINGTQIEIFDNDFTHKYSLKVTINFHIRDWRYNCRCHDKVSPINREVNKQLIVLFIIDN